MFPTAQTLREWARHPDDQCLFVPNNLSRSLRQASACRALMRVLIVDDHADSAKSLVALLQELGHNETRVAYSAATALQTAVEFGPEIVLMDVELPDMSGYDAALLMHQHPRLQRTRLMALTDHAEHPGREQARASGFERYLVKPVTVEALQEVLDMAA